MKHRVIGRRFKRDKAQRKALMKHLSESLILQDRIHTTVAKAKELSPFVEKLVTCAKKNSLASTKMIYGFMAKEPSRKLLQEIAPKYKEQNGGYTRVIKVGERKGDAAEMAIIEFI